MGKSQSPGSAKRPQSSPAKNFPLCTRQQSCRVCKGCKTENCGKCVSCKDMVQFGGTGQRKAKCMKRVCKNMQTVYIQGPKTAQEQSAASAKGKLETPKKDGAKTTLETSKPVQAMKKVKPDDAKTPMVSQKVKSAATSVGANRAVLIEKSPKKASDYPKTPQQSPRTKAQSSIQAQTSPKVKSENRAPPSEKIRAENMKTPQEISSNKTENKAIRSSPRIKPAVVQNIPKVNQQQTEEKGDNILETKTTVTNLPTKHFYPKPQEIKVVGQQETVAKQKSAEDVKTTKQAKEVLTQVTKESGSSSSENATTISSQKNIELPTVKLDSMTKTELKEFIPKLLKLVTGKEEVFYSRRSAKPEWWPDDVAWAASRSAWFSEKYWTDNLKSVVKNCYKHVGKEDLLQSFVADSHIDSRSSESLGSEDMHCEDSVKTGSYPSSPVKIRMFPQDLFLPFSAEIYICFFCEKEFLSKEKMRTHQKDCKERPPDLQKMYSSDSSLHSVSSVQSEKVSEKKSVDKNWSKLSLDKFTGYVGLVPKLTAVKLREQRLSLEEVNCEIIDDIEPVSPVTPKTPKSLISQLSRDDSSHASRKRLSYSLSMESHKDAVTVETESDSDSETETGQDHKQVHEMNLLDIPVSSLLGQRIKNYVHVDTPLSIVEDTSSFCRTPVKNTFLEKLRKKPLIYPILYRPRRIANMHKQNHIYRFRNAEVKEFMSRMNTGLNLSSIEKLKTMKRFSIRVPRLSRRRLLNWIPRRTLDKQLRGAFKGLKYNPYSEFDDTVCEFPSGPTLLAKNIDKLLGLKKRSSQENSKMSMKNSLSLSNFISEEMEAEVSKQKLTLYRSLLYEMSVLKPEVVMEDIGGQVKSVKGDNQDKSQSGSRKVAICNLEKTEEKDVKPRSVFRDMLRRSREERLMAEAEERERKDEYQTLKALLTAPRTPDNVKFLVKSGPVKTTPLSKDIHGVKTERRSPNDDSISIMSGSSEGESFHSSCCQGCCDKKHHLGQQTSGSADLNSSIQDSNNSTPFIQPLHVDVDLSTSKIDEYGIPSPMSISSESPFPPTPSKSSSSSLDHPSQLHMKAGDSVDNSPVMRRETRSTRSLGLSSPVSVETEGNERPVFSLTSSKSHDKINLASVSDSLMKNSMRRIQTEGIQTRSCSGTPSDSPVKRLTRYGSSAPTSPSKVTKQIKLPLDIKPVSKNLESPTSFQNSNADIKFKLRSGGSVSKLGKYDSTLKPKCSSSSPQFHATAANRQNSGSKNCEGIESQVSDGSLRRSKRRSSFLLESVQPTKLRKVYSDMAVNTR
ncbi:uncharacterized protein LOC123528548 isoform X2 [Mercenaria mercenaria]|uniref:uncharacterized protein LOC123528548 isoform X2 n=1 Tax=Mercenaria mercenaria TaxID=6596 RepID=UPI00234E6C56|nr:uncharacterized protein LOC123528548 isoform X2 [Mercenaria mercenaria]